MVRRAIGTEVIGNGGRARGALDRCWLFGIKEAQRVRGETRLIHLAQLLHDGREVRTQRFNIGGSAGCTANRVQVHLHVGETEIAKIGGAQFDDLEVNPRSAIADRLNVELRELAIAPLLWSVVAKELRHCRKSYGLRLGAHAVLDIGPNGAGGCLGSERQGDRIITTRL